MSATTLPIGLPVGMDADLEPLLHRTGEIVPSFYRASEVMVSHNQYPDALVTDHGMPIAAGNDQTREVLRIEMVPPTRRYAIGLVVEGRAELLPQHEFEKLDMLRYEQEIRWKSQGKASPVAPTLRYIPTPRVFVSWKEHPTENKFVPLGFPLTRQVRIEPKLLWSDKLERYETEAEATERKTKEAAEAGDPRDAQIEALRAEIEALKVTPVVEIVRAKTRAPRKPQSKIKMACGEGVLPLVRRHHLAKCEVCKAADVPPAGDAA